MIAAYFLGVELDWHHAFTTEAFIGLARGFNTLIPGALVIQEFSVVGLFALFMPEHSGLGAKYAIVKKHINNSPKPSSNLSLHKHKI